MEKTDIGIRNGKIQSLGLASGAASREVIDATGLTILPGVIDSQVHFREPGLTHKEDLYTGTLGAIAGGVTSIFEMPNTKPNTSTREKLEEKLNLAAAKAKCDYAFFIGATNDNPPTLEELTRIPGCSGVKIFMGSSTGDLLVAEDKYLEAIFANVRHAPISVHCEDEFILKARQPIAAAGRHPRVHPLWRDESSALSATTRIVAIAKKYRRGVHILHVSSKAEMEFLAKNKDTATVECLPQFLTLSAPECYERLGTYAQMNPPVREKFHQDALWKALHAGVIDVLGSDHAPHTRAEKALPYPQSPSGMTGVQTLLPIMLNHVNQKRLSLEQLVPLISTNPARIFGAKDKGAIAVGKDADLTFVDMKKDKVISNSWIKSKVGWTPYDGMKVQGWPVLTMIRGQIAMRDDVIFSNFGGKAVEFRRA
jgi:dihydroorotase